MNKPILILTAFVFFISATISNRTAAFQTSPTKKTITGTVVTPDGKPANGALLILVQGMNQIQSSTTADEQGKFSIAALPNEDDRFTNLSVYHSSGAIKSTNALGLHKKSPKVDFKLEKANPVTITFNGPDGKPITSGKVKLKSRNRRKASGFESLYNAKMIPEVPIQNGSAQIQFLKTGDSITIEVVADGLPTQSTYFTVSKQHDLQLKRRASIKGKVADADNMGVYENVQLRLASHQGRAEGMRCETIVTVEKDGSFETDQLCEGKLTLSGLRTIESKWYIVESYHGQSPDAPKLTSEKPTNVNLTMKRANEIEGRVTDAAGKPIPGVILSFAGLQTTDKNGKFSGFLPPGHAHGQIRSVPDGFLLPGGFGGMIYITVPNKDTKTKVSDIQLENADPISGIVTDEQGNPIAGANVYASWMARSDGGTFTGANDSTQSNENGEFTLKRTNGTVVTTIQATSSNGATLDKITVRPGASRQIEIVIRKSARLSSIGRVTDSNGKPIENAKVEFWSHGEHGNSSVMFFDEGRKLSVNKNGEFKTSPRMTRGNKYSLIVAAPGFSSIKIEETETPTKGDLDFGTIKLVAANQVSGKIVDTNGKPISGATVWSFGSSHTRSRKRKSCESNNDGRFSLTDISSDARFFFVDHESFRFRGALIKSTGKARTIKMARFDQPAFDKPVRIGNRNSQVRETAVGSMLNAIINDSDAIASRFTRLRASKLLAKMNPASVTELLDELDQDGSKIQVLLSAGIIEAAIELARTLPPKEAHGLLIAVNKSSQSEYQSGVELSPAQIRKLLAEASATAAKAKSADLKIQQYSQLATAYRALGDEDKAKSIIHKIKQLAIETELQDHLAGMFARAIAPDDPELALKTIDRIERDFSKGRWFSNAFAASAKSGHNGVQKFIEATEDPSDVADHLAHAVYDLAKIDLDKTIEMVEKAQDRYSGMNKAKCYAHIAMSIYDTKPDQAKQLLRKAFKIIGNVDSNFTDSASFTLLRYAQFVDPESSGEYWWRAVSLYGGPNPNNPNRTPEIETQERRASLALLLALYGRFPETQSDLVEPLFEYWEAIDASESLIEGIRRRAPRGIDFRDSKRTMTAMALYDPERSTELMKKWWPAGHERFNRSPDSPWIIVADILTAEGDQLCRLISKRVFYQWILGDDDGY